MINGELVGGDGGGLFTTGFQSFTHLIDRKGYAYMYVMFKAKIDNSKKFVSIEWSLKHLSNKTNLD